MMNEEGYGKCIEVDVGQMSRADQRQEYIKECNLNRRIRRFVFVILSSELEGMAGFTPVDRGERVL